MQREKERKKARAHVLRDARALAVEDGDLVCRVGALGRLAQLLDDLAERDNLGELVALALGLEALDVELVAQDVGGRVTRLQSRRPKLLVGVVTLVGRALGLVAHLWVETVMRESAGAAVRQRRIRERGTHLLARRLLALLGLGLGLCLALALLVRLRVLDIALAGLCLLLIVLFSARHVVVLVILGRLALLAASRPSVRRPADRAHDLLHHVVQVVGQRVVLDAARRRRARVGEDLLVVQEALGRRLVVVGSRRAHTCLLYTSPSPRDS